MRNSTTCSLYRIRSWGPSTVATHEVNTGDNSPIYQRARRKPFALRGQVKKMVQEMLDRGILCPSASPWASPIVFVRKPDGSYRFCVDYRRLNLVTRKDVFPLTRIEDLIDLLYGASIYICLDAFSGYWQVPLKESSKERTAFITQYLNSTLCRLDFVIPRLHFSA